MRIIPSENDGFVLVPLDLAFLDEMLFFSADPLQEDTVAATLAASVQPLNSMLKLHR